MRYYDLRVTSAETGLELLQFGSYPGGRYDPGAPNCIFNILTYAQSTPMGNSTITVEGVPVSLLSGIEKFGFDVNGKPRTNIAFKGGMGPGLPLANPKQIGLLAGGSIFQAWGTWVGTEVSISFTLAPSPYSQANPGPIVLNWKAGSPLSSALKSTLQTAYPGWPITMNISDVVLAHDEVHAANTLTGLATYLNGITTTDVQIVANGNAIRVFDSSYRPAPKRIAFKDFVGQPAWHEPYTMQTMLVLRGDLQVGDYLQMPQDASNFPTFAQQSAAAMPSQVNYKSAMQGQFQIKALRHVGNLRQPRGNEWCTIVNAVTQN